jgi:hypothetical protein
MAKWAADGVLSFPVACRKVNTSFCGRQYC